MAKKRKLLRKLSKNQQQKACSKKSSGKKIGCKKNCSSKKPVKKSAPKKTTTKKVTKKPTQKIVKKTIAKPVVKSTIDYSKAVTPLGDRLVVRVVQNETMTAGGLYIPDMAQSSDGYLKGTVLAVGQDHTTKKVFCDQWTYKKVIKFFLQSMPAQKLF